MPTYFFDADFSQEAVPQASPAPRPGGAYRVVIATDDHGNQCLQLLPEDRAIFVTFMPHCGTETDRRAVKDAFARIGNGLTSVPSRVGAGEWHPGYQPAVCEPVDVMTGVGPATREARGDFLNVLALLGQLLGQEMVMGLMLPLGQVFEVWDHCLIKSRSTGQDAEGRSPVASLDR